MQAQGFASEAGQERWANIQWANDRRANRNYTRSKYGQHNGQYPEGTQMDPGRIVSIREQLDHAHD